ncbi:metallophosphoesterase [Lapidilactobacillus wuchangensis]|uniref:metallophosphoesterase n=1 Tax=Lapidilactobacillus wuchangensis TaxID=2486001 RepID=UPI000F7A48ED|nr:metallophosphoesterase [Lapidilactobacillus wuchangensis]
MNIAISSDNHFDINKAATSKIVFLQASYLKQLAIDYYFITGDLFNNFEQTINYVEQLQREVGSVPKIYFIAGNHDMLNGVTYAELERPNLHPQYLHHRILQIPHKNLSVVGNNGWYDYSFSDQIGDNQKSTAEILRWKQSFWVDQKIDSPISDQERMQNVLQQVETDFKQVTRQHEKVLFLTHFVPHQNFIFDQLDHPRWQTINAFLGSKHLGDLIEKYPVQYAAFGHLHIRHLPQTIANTTYIHQPLGYGVRRAFEWQQTDFLTEWQRTLKILVV